MLPSPCLSLTLSVQPSLRRTIRTGPGWLVGLNDAEKSPGLPFNSNVIVTSFGNWTFSVLIRLSYAAEEDISVKHNNGIRYQSPGAIVANRTPGRTAAYGGCLRALAFNEVIEIPEFEICSSDYRTVWSARRSAAVVVVIGSVSHGDQREREKFIWIINRMIVWEWSLLR